MAAEHNREEMLARARAISEQHVPGPTEHYGGEVVRWLLAELERVEAERDALMRQRWSNENRAEVAERGHKACLTREAEHGAALAREQTRAEQLERVAGMADMAMRQWFAGVDAVEYDETISHLRDALAALAAAGAATKEEES